jgi:predicted DNA-binding WGR domain protein
MTLLHRLNPEKNEARYYRVDVGPCVIADHAVHRVWGRIGRRRSGFMINPCTNEAEAQGLAGRLVAVKVKRGYTIIEP